MLYKLSVVSIIFASAVRSAEFSDVETILNNFVFYVSPRTVNCNCQKLKNDVEVKFLGSCQALTYNVFAACFGRIETAVCRNAFNKDKCLMDFCKEKINNFPEGTLFAKALLSARLEQAVC